MSVTQDAVQAENQFLKLLEMDEYEEAGDMPYDMPTADAGAPYNTFTPDTGSTLYSRIDEIPPDDDSSYIFADAVGQEAGVVVDDLPPNATSVRAVVGWCRAKKTDAGICTINIGVLSAGVEGWGPDIPLTTAETYFESIFETDPATGAPWVPAAVNAAKLLYRRVA